MTWYPDHSQPSPKFLVLQFQLSNPLQSFTVTLFEFDDPSM